jgi:hypothetical protein
MALFRSNLKVSVPHKEELNTFLLDESRLENGQCNKKQSKNTELQVANKSSRNLKHKLEFVLPWLMLTKVVSGS